MTSTGRLRHAGAKEMGYGGPLLVSSCCKNSRPAGMELVFGGDDRFGGNDFFDGSKNFLLQRDAFGGGFDDQAAVPDPGVVAVVKKMFSRTAAACSGFIFFFRRPWRCTRQCAARARLSGASTTSTRKSRLDGMALLR